MKISEVRVITTCPAEQTFVLVKVLTDAGVYGVGEGTKNGRELAVAALLEHHLAPTLIGRDPGAIEDIWKYLMDGGLIAASYLVSPMLGVGRRLRCSSTRSRRSTGASVS